MSNVIHVDFRKREIVVPKREYVPQHLDEAALREADFSEAAIADMREIAAMSAPRAGRTYGAKYDPSLTLKDIAKRVRSTLFTRYPGWSFSAKSAQRAIVVRITNVPDHVKVYNPTWLSAHKAAPHDSLPGPRYSQEMSDVLAFIKRELGSYRYDNSDAMTDYFDTNFYPTVGLDHLLEETRAATEG